MASPSKEDNILRLILENSPFKEWHFEKIVREANVTKAVANKWLKKFVKEGLLHRIKQKNKFPHYSAGSGNPAYHSFKRIYMLEQLHRCGLISKLLSLKGAKTVILFGSAAKGDWYKDSDVDIFTLGKPSGFDKGDYESKLHRRIEMHIFPTKKEIKNVQSGLLQNVINGYLVKGKVQDIIGAI